MNTMTSFLLFNLWGTPSGNLIFKFNETSDAILADIVPLWTKLLRSQNLKFTIPGIKILWEVYWSEKKKKRETTLFFFNFHSQPVNTESNGIASDVNHNLSAYINACTQGNYLNSQDNC